MLGAVVKWFIIIATLMAVAGILDMPQITDFLRQILLYIPQAFVAVVILTMGVIAGQFVKNVVSGSLEASELPVKYKGTIGMVAQYAVVVFAVMAALNQLGVAQDLVRILFGRRCARYCSCLCIGLRPWWQGRGVTGSCRTEKKNHAHRYTLSIIGICGKTLLIF